MSPPPVSVGRLRVQDVRRDPLATRAALDRLLGTAALRPRALPPAAILVVRALRDPLPQRLRLDRAGIRPPPEWEHAVATSLDHLARGAARPAHKAVGANAAAVLFADRAELLACLLADWAAGAISSRWWWRLVVRGSPDVAVPAELRAWPTYVPAAFAALAERGAAVAVAAALPPEEALATARSVAASFGVPVPRGEEARAEDQLPAIAASGSPAKRVSQEHDVTRTAPAWSPVAATLLPSVPEARASGLRAEQRLLLAVALGIRRAPAAMRIPSELPPEERPAASSADPSPAELPSDGPTVSGRAAGAAAPAAATPGSSPPAAGPDAERPNVRVEPRTRPPNVHWREPATDPPPPAATAPVPRAHAAVRADEVASAPVADLTRAAPARTHEPDTEGLPLFGPAVQTRLGGLFFLVNVGIDLGLYGDFTQPARPGIALDVWDFLTLAGRQLARGAGDDAVWRLLAELAGRGPDDPPGAGSVPPGGATLADWTVATTDEIRVVLAEAGLVPSRLLRRPATVHVTEAHVDVVFALAGHPLEIRIAGLDRDPGFVPAAGRHVAFHFE